MGKKLDLDTETAIVFGADGITLHMPRYSDLSEVPTYASLAAYILLLFENDPKWLDDTIERGSRLLEIYGGLDTEVTKQ